MSTRVSRKSLEPWIPDEVTYYDHQVEGIRELARRTSFILGDDMGLGKTLQALTVFAIDVVLGRSRRMLVVCPVTLKDNWAAEIEKHTRFRYMILGHEVDGNGDIRSLSPARRDEQILQFISCDEPCILIVNYEQVSKYVPAFNTIQFDVACFDEAHFMKNMKSARTKACLQVRSRRTFLLTGSPLLNDPRELWTLLHKVDPGRWPRYWTFVNRYCVFTKDTYRVKKKGDDAPKQVEVNTLVGVKNEKELTTALGGVMLRRLKKDVLDLPEVQIINRVVGLHPIQRELYDRVVEEMKLEVPTDPDSDEDIDNALTKFLRLKQICGTTATILGPEKDHSYKLDLATSDDIELLLNGEKVVVFTQFRGVLAAYARRMQDFVPDIPLFELHGDVPKTDRIPLIKRWESIDGPAVIVCGLQVASLGINLTAARHASFLDKLFVPKMNQQAVDRLHRIGQSTTQPVQVREYRVRGTIETRIEAILRGKEELFDRIVDRPLLKKTIVKALLAKAE